MRSRRTMRAMLAATFMLVVSGVAGGVLSGALAASSDSAGAERLNQVTATPTRPPPEGQWSVNHGPNYQPLWSVNPPALRGVPPQPAAP